MIWDKLGAFEVAVWKAGQEGIICVKIAVKLYQVVATTTQGLQLTRVIDCLSVQFDHAVVRCQIEVQFESSKTLFFKYKKSYFDEQNQSQMVLLYGTRIL